MSSNSPFEGDAPSSNDPLKKDAQVSDDSDCDEMPPLENIVEEMENLPENKGQIRGVPGESDEEEFEENDGWIDILSNGDLRKKTIKPAPEPQRPQRGNKCILRIVTRIFDDASSDQIDGAKGPIVRGESFERFSVVVGDMDLHQGLDLILPLMDCGETARVLIKPRFAYGPVGNLQVGVPPETTLDVEVEILEIVPDFENPYGEDGMETGDANPIVNGEPLEERNRFGNQKKTRGNFWFERGEYSLSIQCYKGAVRYLDASEAEIKLLDTFKKNEITDKEDEKKARQVEDLVDKRSQTFNNLAAAQLKMQAFDSALRSVEDCLLLRPNNVKALFRRAKIRVEKGMLEEAIDDLKKASSIDPNSEAITVELTRLNKVLAHQNNEQRNMYRRMMQSNGTQQQQQSPKANKESRAESKSSKSKSSPSPPFVAGLSSKKDSSGLMSRLSSTTVLTVTAVALAAIIPLIYTYLR